jgi:hypothetical protein
MSILRDFEKAAAIIPPKVAGTVFSRVAHVGGMPSAESAKQPIRQPTSIKTVNQAAAAICQILLRDGSRCQ